MNIRPLLLIGLYGLTAGVANAYPPAPFHRIFGTVRDERGAPLGSETGTVILNGVGGVEIVRGMIDPEVGLGVNYSLSVPMDSGTTAVLYQVTALRPLLPFTVRVLIDGVNYIPIQATGGSFNMGDPAGQTRIDLTVGVDSDGDGIPDRWEYDLIEADDSGRFQSLEDVRPEDDLDGDGLTNFQEYIAGTYALDGLDRLELDIISESGGYARLRFLAIGGRTYRIYSSTTLRGAFSEQGFSLSPGGVPMRSYISSGVEHRDVYVSVSDMQNMFFTLSAQ